MDYVDCRRALDEYRRGLSRVLAPSIESAVRRYYGQVADDWLRRGLLPPDVIVVSSRIFRLLEGER